MVAGGGDEDPGGTGGCGSVGLGGGCAVWSPLNFSQYSLKVTRGHSKAINMDCGLAVVSTPASWCP